MKGVTMSKLSEEIGKLKPGNPEECHRISLGFNQAKHAFTALAQETLK